MKVYLNIKTAASVPYYIAFYNFNLLEFPQSIILKTFLSKAARHLSI